MKAKVLLLTLISIRLSAQPPVFDAQGLLYLRDADYNVSTKQTHQIEKTGVDIAGMLKLPIDYINSRSPSEQNISNSILNNHRPMAVNPVSKRAYILETAGSVSEKSTDDSFLQPGSFISVVNTINIDKIKPEYRFPVADHPNSVSLDHTNKYLAVSSNSPGNEIQIFELDESGRPLRLLPSISSFKIAPVNDLVWHPGGEYLVFIRREEKEMGMIKVVRNGKEIIRLDQLGDVISFEGDPVYGEFSKDGNSFFVLDKGDPDLRVRGQVFSIKLSFDENQRHSFMSKAQTDLDPVSLSIHPSGKYIFISNAIFSDQPNTYGESSLSVLQIDNNMLTNRLSFPMSGVWPSSVNFDKTGNHFLVSFFRSKEYGKPIGKIGFYNFESSPNPKITEQKAQVNTQTGTHYIKVVY